MPEKWYLPGIIRTGQSVDNLMLLIRKTRPASPPFLCSFTLTLTEESHFAVFFASLSYNQLPAKWADLETSRQSPHH